MTVSSVDMGLPRNLSSLGTKDASTTLFAGISLSRIRIIMSKQAPTAFKDGYRDRFFIVFFYIEIICYLYWIFDVKDLFALFSMEYI